MTVPSEFPTGAVAAMFVRAVAVLALPAEAQVAWLRSLGLGEPGYCDELADEYFQQWRLLPQLITAEAVPARAKDGLDELNELLGRIEDSPDDLMAVGALTDAPEWDRVRQQARVCLHQLK